MPREWRIHLMKYLVNFCNDPTQVNIAKYLRSEGLTNSARYWINRDTIYCAIIEVIMGMGFENRWLKKLTSEQRHSMLNAVVLRLKGFTLHSITESEGVSLKTIYSRCGDNSLMFMCFKMLSGNYLHILDHFEKAYGDNL